MRSRKKFRRYLPHPGVQACICYRNTLLRISNTTPWRASLHHLIFEAETNAGKIFDIILMILIALSVATVMMDSIAAVRIEYGEVLHNLEWFFTIVFAIEYVLRLVATLRP